MVREIAWLAVAGALAVGCSSETPKPAPAAAARPSPGAPRGSREAPIPDDLDLEAMLAPVPEYEGAGRDLFSYGAARRTVEETADLEPPPGPEIPREAPVIVPRPGRPSSAPVARVDMKYAGFLEKTRPSGEKEKYAIFLDGNEILAGAEGETLANRFTVVEIGLESVIVSPAGSSATQRIPLQSK
jgi:hypothetical protein